MDAASMECGHHQEGLHPLHAADVPLQMLSTPRPHALSTTLSGQGHHRASGVEQPPPCPHPPAGCNCRPHLTWKRPHPGGFPLERALVAAMSSHTTRSPQYQLYTGSKMEEWATICMLLTRLRQLSGGRGISGSSGRPGERDTPSIRPPITPRTVRTAPRVGGCKGHAGTPSYARATSGR